VAGVTAPSKTEPAAAEEIAKEAPKKLSFRDRLFGTK